MTTFPWPERGPFARMMGQESTMYSLCSFQSTPMAWSQISAQISADWCPTGKPLYTPHHEIGDRNYCFDVALLLRLCYYCRRQRNRELWDLFATYLHSLLFCAVFLPLYHFFNPWFASLLTSYSWIIKYIPNGDFIKTKCDQKFFGQIERKGELIAATINWYGFHNSASRSETSTDFGCSFIVLNLDVSKFHV